MKHLIRILLFVSCLAGAGQIASAQQTFQFVDLQKAYSIPVACPSSFSAAQSYCVFKKGSGWIHNAQVANADSSLGNIYKQVIGSSDSTSQTTGGSENPTKKQGIVVAQGMKMAHSSQQFAQQFKTMNVDSIQNLSTEDKMKFAQQFMNSNSLAKQLQGMPTPPQPAYDSCMKFIPAFDSVTSMLFQILADYSRKCDSTMGSGGQQHAQIQAYLDSAFSSDNCTSDECREQHIQEAAKRHQAVCDQELAPIPAIIAKYRSDIKQYVDRMIAFQQVLHNGNDIHDDNAKRQYRGAIVQAFGAVAALEGLAVNAIDHARGYMQVPAN